MIGVYFDYMIKFLMLIQEIKTYSKCRIFEFWHFLPIFVKLKLICLVALFDRKRQFFKNSTKLTIFSILSTKNVNVARFAGNVEWDFFCDFQTLRYLAAFGGI